ncbi:MAG TPA: STAS domain-containing protein [Trebonia sp.]
MTEGTAGPRAIVTLPGEIDITNSAAVKASVLAVLDDPGLVIVDMTGTTFCDSSGLRTLIVARDRAAASGCTLRIVIRPDSSVARSLAILGMDRMLPIYASVKDAMPAGLPL